MEQLSFYHWIPVTYLKNNTDIKNLRVELFHLIIYSYEKTVLHNFL